MSTPTDNLNTTSARGSGAAWLTLLAAAGITATAVLVARRIQKSGVGAGVDDLLHLCDRAAAALDERIGSIEVALAG